MAESVILVNLANSLLNNLGSRALNEIASAWGFKAQLEQLQNTINTIQNVLLDAEEKKLQSRTIEGWLQRLQAVVYTADDLFDEFATLAARKRAIPGSKLAKEVRIFFSGSNQIAFAFSISREIKRIRKELDGIVNEGNQFVFMVRPYEEQQAVCRQRCEDYMFTNAEEVVGRDKEKKAMLDKLLNSSSDHRNCNFTVVSICGLGGIGKATLARLIYNDEEVRKNFELRMWVHMPDSSNVGEVVKSILMAVTETEPPNLCMEQLVGLLRKHMGGKKYFLVLNDVWKTSEWYQLSSLFNFGKEGSKILATMRCRGTAREIGSAATCLLSGLSEEDSWNLFRKVAFQPGQEQKNPELLKIGEEILKMCPNIPLAIRTLGSALHGEDERKWLYLKERSLIEMPVGSEFVDTVLEFSYTHLSSPLKNCFAYCALFSEGYEFKKETLINLWMAQGFVIPTYERESLEEAAEEYFLTLLHRCFFKDITKDDNGNIISCKMHHLILDLAKKVARTECRQVGYGEINFDERIRHLSLGYSLSSSCEIPVSMRTLKQLRTFLLPEQRNDQSMISESICHKLFVKPSMLAGVGSA